MLAPLQDRPFRILAAARTVSVAGDSFLPIALSFAVLRLTGSVLDLGLVLMAGTIPTLALLLVGGVWSDRFPRNHVMVAADTARAISQFTMAVLLLTGTAQIWHLMALQAVHGAGEAFFNPAAAAVVPQTVPPERLQEANGILGLSTGIAFALGPGLAGVLVAATSPGWAILLDSATFVVSAGLLSTLHIPAPRTGDQPPAFLRELAEGWSEFRARTWVWVMVLHWGLLLLLAEAPFDVLGPLIAERSLGGAAAWGLIETGFAVGLLAGRVVASKSQTTRPLAASAVALLLAAPGYALLAAEMPTASIAIVRFLAGAAFTYYGTLWATTLQRRIPAERLSRVSSYEWLGSMSLMPVGYALAGPASSLFSVPGVLWFSAGWVLLSTAALAMLPSVRAVTRSAEEAA